MTYQPRLVGLDEPAVSDTLYLYGEIYGDGAVTKEVSAFLEQNAGASELTVRVNSPGGDVFEGNAIYHLLKQATAKIVLHIDGLAASVGSLIAMAGDEIHMAENAMLMIHDPYTPLTSGGPDKLRKTADLLERMRETQVAVYAARSGQKPKDVRAAMAAETWYTAKEAKALGYVDKIAKPQKLAARLNFDLTGYRNTPEALSAAAPAGPVVNPPTPAAAPVGAAHIEERKMKTLLSKLSLSENATEAEAVTALAGLITGHETRLTEVKGQVSQLLSATGETTVDAALGVIAAGKSAAEQVAALTEEIEAGKKKAEADERTQIVAKLKSEKKLTTAQEKKFVPTASLETLKRFAETAPVVMGTSQHTEGSDDGSTGSARLTHQGKHYEQLSGREKAALRESDCDSYDALRTDWINAGQPAPTS